jgi:predicted DNA-binding transcriptional regulator YafY
MVGTSARLLRLLALLQSRRFWTGPELAERLRITPRTVRRDVDRLRSLGYPVESSSGLAGGYQLAAGRNLPPLLLDDDEALAVSLGVRLATAGTVAGIEESALRALAKLEQVLPVRLQKRVRELHAAVAPLGPGGPRIAPEQLITLAGACRGLERLTFRYRDREGRDNKRDVEPHALVCTGSRWYLLAWDVTRAGWRTFRVDRIAGKPVAGRRFLPRRIPGGDAADYVSRALSIEPYPVRARIVLHAPLEKIAELIPRSAGRLERFDDRHCLLEAGAQGHRTLAYHLTLLNVDFEVLDPPELISYVRQVAERLTRAVAASVTNAEKST